MYGVPGWNPFAVGDPGAGSSPNTIRGTIAENDPNGAPSATGYTSGPFNWTTTAQTIVPNSGGCAYQYAYGYPYALRRDIAYIPNTDIYGNTTHGYRTDFDYWSQAHTSGQDSFPSGPYSGKLRPDSIRTLFNAGYNTTESQGVTIRANNTLNPMIAAIGLGGNGSYPADAELLIRLANVPSGLDPSNNNITNTIYNSSRPQGIYVYSPSASQLANAFAQIASFLVELSR